MDVTIGLSEQNAAELEAQARAAHMSPDRYLAEVVAHALESQHRCKVRKLEEHLDVMAAHVVPGTTTDEMEAALEEALTEVRSQREESDDQSVAEAARRLATFGKRHGLSLGGMTIKELLRESRP
jgi:predicted RNA-binding protein